MDGCTHIEPLSCCHAEMHETGLLGLADWNHMCLESPILNVCIGFSQSFIVTLHCMKRLLFPVWPVPHLQISFQMTNMFITYDMLSFRCLDMVWQLSTFPFSRTTQLTYVTWQLGETFTGPSCKMGDSLVIFRPTWHWGGLSGRVANPAQSWPSATRLKSTSNTKFISIVFDPRFIHTNALTS